MRQCAHVCATYAVLPDSHTLATAMDMMGSLQHAAIPAAGNGPDPAPGGLLEFDSRGNYLRRVSAEDPNAGSAVISPYGIAVKPEIDELVREMDKRIKLFRHAPS